MDSTLLFTSGAIAFAMAWAIGAQDVSNALGTSVGSKALTVRQAIYVGAICEFTGSLMGGEVAAAISGGILNMNTFQDLGDAGTLLYGRCMFVTMCGAFVWLAVATYYSLPVSTTHSLVGSLIGVGVLSMSADGIKWATVGKIVSSWVSSPLMGGIVGYVMYWLINWSVFSRPAPHKAAARALPYFAGFTIGLLVAFMGVAGPRAYRVSPAFALLLGIVASGIAGVMMHWKLSSEPQPLDGDDHGKTVEVAVQHHDASNGAADAETASLLPKQASDKTNGSAADGTAGGVGGGAGSSAAVDSTGITAKPSTRNVLRSGSPVASASVVDPAGAEADGEELAQVDTSSAQPSPAEVAEGMFKGLMVLTACVVSFAHGSNDVSNSIGPFNAIVMIHQTGTIRPDAPVPLWVLIAGGVGIVVGLGTYGHRVMATVGESITKLTFSRGFAAQIGTAGTVLTATQLGVSVSTTHCLIGAISGVALVEGSGKLNSATLKKIAASWVITLPASALFSVILFVLVDFVAPL